MPAQSELGPLIKEVHSQLCGRLHDFKIDRREDGIVLLGSAQSFYVKQLALHVAKRMSPVPILGNEIEVD
jgi:hypothetical protein